MKHATSHLNNNDHLSVGLNMLAEVYDKLRDFDQESRYLAALIEFHPSLPTLWIRFGKAIMNMKSNNLFLLANAAFERLFFIFFKFIRKSNASLSFRGLNLMKSVERTVSGFVKDSNLRSQVTARSLIESIPISLDQKSYVSSRVISSMNFDVDDDDTVEADFEDLGSSKRLMAIEKDFQTFSHDSKSEQTFSLPTLPDFERKWFPFLSAAPTDLNTNLPQ